MEGRCQRERDLHEELLSRHLLLEQLALLLHQLRLLQTELGIALLLLFIGKALLL